MNINITQCLMERLNFFLNSEYSSDEEIRKCFFDYVGVMIAGAESLKNKHTKYVQLTGISGSAFVVGTNIKTDVYSAALLNGLSAHVLELDDGHRYGMLHPGAVIFSALLAVASVEQIHPDSFFRAAAAGYEIMIRTACMVQPDHKKRGFHASATCGTIGAAVAIAVARNYSGDCTRNTISAAATSASGLLEMIDDDSELKPYNCARAAANGIMAANIAVCGYRGPEDAMGGERGFIKAHNGIQDEEKVLFALSLKDCVGTIYRKMYASCRHTHSAVEAALELRALYRMEPLEIKFIRIATYDLAVFGHDNVNPLSISAGKMSTPYSVAVAIIYGRAGLDAFTEKLLKDPLVCDLEKKVKVISDPGLTSLCPNIRAAEVTVGMRDGKIYTQKTEYPKGEPENPLSSDEMEKKFRTLLFTAGKAEKWIEEIQDAIFLSETNWNNFFDLIVS